MHKMKKKPCKKSEKVRYFTLDVFKVTSGGNIKHSEANYVLTAAAVTNSVTFVEISKTLKINVVKTEWNWFRIVTTGGRRLT
jgi:hypothetical protein